MRSEERIPRLRSRGRANRRKLLETAERLLAEPGTGNLRFSDIFAAAGVSRGSAYRIYIGIDDLLHDLVAEWLNNFVDHLASSEPPAAPDDWVVLSDFLVERAADYWKSTDATLRVLPRIRTNVPESHQRSQLALSRILGEIFARYFVLPTMEDWHQVLGFYVQLCDASFSDSVRREGRITEQRLGETQALCRTYLAFYLPSWLPSRVDTPRSRS
jgi:AcrR family transcriptional regulator